LLFYSDKIKDQSSLLFFNDLQLKKRNSIISQLHYPTASQVKDDKSYADFERIINIANWKKTASPWMDKFIYLIDNLLADFVGREDELEKMTDFLNRESGFYIMQGEPGSGKSALAARFAEQLKGQQQHVCIEYYFKRGNEYNHILHFYQQLKSALEPYSQVTFDYHQPLEEQHTSVLLLIKEASEKLAKKQRKLVFIIDGLDEVSLSNYLLLPYQEQQNLFVYYSSRTTKDVISFVRHIEGHKLERPLDGIQDDDIRALLWKLVSKYELDNDFYVKKINETSKGNALYVNLLAKAIVNGEVPQNDIKKLPQRIEDFYYKMWDRLAKTQQLKNFLMFIATSGRALTERELKELLQDDVQEAADEILEVLTIDNGSYYIFHESFREFLVDTPQLKELVIQAHVRLLKYCENFESIVSNYETKSHYPLQYYSYHLAELYKVAEYRADVRRQFIQLVQNQAYLNTQLEHTQTLEYTIQLFSLAIERCNDITLVKSLVTQMEKMLANIDEIVLELLQNQPISDEDSKRLFAYIPLLTPEKQQVVYMYILYLFVNEKQYDLVLRVVEQLTKPTAVVDLTDYLSNIQLFRLEKETNLNLVELKQRTNCIDYEELFLSVNFENLNEVILVERYFHDIEHEKVTLPVRINWILTCIENGYVDLAEKALRNVESIILEHAEYEKLLCDVIYAHYVLGHTEQVNILLAKNINTIVRNRVGQMRYTWPKPLYNQCVMLIEDEDSKRIMEKLFERRIIRESRSYEGFNGYLFPEENTLEDVEYSERKYDREYHQEKGWFTVRRLIEEETPSTSFNYISEWLPQIRRKPRNEFAYVIRLFFSQMHIEQGLQLLEEELVHLLGEQGVASMTVRYNKETKLNYYLHTNNNMQVGKLIGESPKCQPHFFTVDYIRYLDYQRLSIKPWLTLLQEKSILTTLYGFGFKDSFSRVKFTLRNHIEDLIVYFASTDRIEIAFQLLSAIPYRRYNDFLPYPGWLQSPLFVNELKNHDLTVGYEDYLKSSENENEVVLGCCYLTILTKNEELLQPIFALVHSYERLVENRKIRSRYSLQKLHRFNQCYNALTGYFFHVEQWDNVESTLTSINQLNHQAYKQLNLIDVLEWQQQYQEVEWKQKKWMVHLELLYTHRFMPLVSSKEEQSIVQNQGIVNRHFELMLAYYKKKQDKAMIKALLQTAMQSINEEVSYGVIVMNGNTEITQLMKEIVQLEDFPLIEELFQRLKNERLREQCLQVIACHHYKASGFKDAGPQLVSLLKSLPLSYKEKTYYAQQLMTVLFKYRKSLKRIIYTCVPYLLRNIESLKLVSKVLDEVEL
jgi:ABC-type dipeptide/oligopeptide/nickel transport system ATPase subunit